MTHKIIFSEGAWQDFDGIYDWIEDRADAQTALRYLTRIHDFCLTLRDFPFRGTPRDDLGSGVRTVVFEDRAVIAYSVEGKLVTIVRILARGRDVSRAFSG